MMNEQRCFRCREKKTWNRRNAHHKCPSFRLLVPVLATTPHLAIWVPRDFSVRDALNTIGPSNRSHFDMTKRVPRFVANFISFFRKKPISTDGSSAACAAFAVNRSVSRCRRESLFLLLLWLLLVWLWSRRCRRGKYIVSTVRKAGHSKVR